MQLLEGKPVAAFYKEHIAATLAALKEEQAQPELAIVLVGDDAPSALYAKSMQKVASGVGLGATIHTAPADVTEDTLLQMIHGLNNDDKVIGILLMMPLPEHIHAARIINAIAPEKDVDGLTDSNIAHLFSGQLCLACNATVTICHSHTQDLASITKTADILIAAVGKANFVTKDMVKSGAVVIDVGINRVNGKTVGDVDFTSVAAMAGAITPVPGGVGTVTTTMVLANALMGID